MLQSEEVLVLLALAVAEHPAEVLEIGTYMGHITSLMAENLPNAMIHTVDLPENFVSEQNPNVRIPLSDFHLIKQRKVGRDFHGLECKKRIRQHFSDTADWDFRQAGNPAFFFIDGSHTYDYCKNDSEKCLTISARPAVFLWHDCNDDHPGVVKFILEWRSLGRDIRRVLGTNLAYWKTE
jgi:hypothetical protein